MSRWLASKGPVAAPRAVEGSPQPSPRPRLRFAGESLDEDSYPGLLINWDAGPSWITCTHRGKCDCQEASERACREQRAAKAAAPAPAPEPAKPAQPQTWRDFEENCGEWKDDLARIIATLRAFPDALKAILTLLDARDVAT